MRAVIAGIKREILLQEINKAFLQWPELDRRVFSEAHYYGKSAEAISRSLQLDVEEVSVILKKCERRLYASLRSFRGSLIPPGIDQIPACEQDLELDTLAS